MTEPFSRSSHSEFTREEFTAFVADVADSKGRSEAEDDAMVAEFDRLVPHPAKRDLIFWSEEGADDSPAGIVAEIERHCCENGSSGFKDSGF